MFLCQPLIPLSAVVAASIVRCLSDDDTPMHCADVKEDNGKDGGSFASMNSESAGDGANIDHITGQKAATHLQVRQHLHSSPCEHEHMCSLVRDSTKSPWDYCTAARRCAWSTCSLLSCQKHTQMMSVSYAGGELGCTCQAGSCFHWNTSRCEGQPGPWRCAGASCRLSCILCREALRSREQM